MTIMPPPGTPRHQTIPSMDEMMDRFSHLPPHEARYWANREREKLLTRAPIPPSLRREVYARDGHACLDCGATENLSLDHIIPWSLCGPDTAENLQTLCRPCNSRKGARA